MSASGNVPVLPTIWRTNERFLQAAFGAAWLRALVTWFPGDPGPGSPDADWSARLASYLPRPQATQQYLNTYFCPSLVRGDKRHVAEFVSLNVLVIDDYGTKVVPGLPEELLGQKPDYVLQTSPGNYQAGWFLEPLTDLAWVKGMLTQLRAALGAGDNLTDPVIWRRLPIGINGKPQHRRKGRVWTVS